VLPYLSTLKMHWYLKAIYRCPGLFLLYFSPRGFLLEQVEVEERKGWPRFIWKNGHETEIVAVVVVVVVVAAAVVVALQWMNKDGMCCVWTCPAGITGDISADAPQSSRLRSHLLRAFPLRHPSAARCRRRQPAHTFLWVSFSRQWLTYFLQSH